MHFKGNLLNSSAISYCVCKLVYFRLRFYDFLSKGWLELISGANREDVLFGTWCILREIYTTGLLTVTVFRSQVGEFSFSSSMLFRVLG